MKSLLPLDEIRDLADDLGLTEVDHNETSCVIAFKGGPSTAKRINVWYTTGTVGTFINHPRQGPTQLFRRKVDMEMLRKIFTDPRLHTGLGYRQKKESDPVNFYLSEEDAAMKQKKRLLEETKSLEEELENVEQILNSCKRRRQEEQERIEEEQKKKARAAEHLRRGRLFLTSLSEANCDWVYEQLEPKSSCVAMGGDADGVSQTIVLDEDEVWAYTGDIPTKVRNLLKSRPSSASPPTYVSLGSDYRYFIQFANGKMWWHGPDDFCDEVHKDSRSIANVAFGEDFDTYFLVWDDGDYTYGGNIPDDLYDLLLRRQHKRDLTCVCLGPSGEWFISCKNGRKWWGGMDEEDEDRIDEIRNRVTWMDFGGSNTYIVRYN